MLVSFCDWMRRQRGASDATLSIYKFELRAFIKKLGEDPRMYDARNLRQFVLDKSQQSGWASARKSICAIRMFLRFLISQGRCPTSLYASVPTLAHWRLSALPRYLQPDQVEKVIASPDLTTSLGRRNRAILLLLARLGLRAGDLVQLRLGDLDWREGMICVSGKGRRHAVLPLTQEVGDALAAYIKDHRPQAPFEPGRLMPPENFGIIKSKRTASGLCSRANPTCSTRMRWRRARNFTSRPFRKMSP